MNISGQRAELCWGDVPNNMTALMQCRTVEVFPIKAES